MFGTPNTIQTILDSAWFNFQMTFLFAALVVIVNSPGPCQRPNAATDEPSLPSFDARTHNSCRGLVAKGRYRSSFQHLKPTYIWRSHPQTLQLQKKTHVEIFHISVVMMLMVMLLVVEVDVTSNLYLSGNVHFTVLCTNVTQGMNVTQGIYIYIHTYTCIHIFIIHIHNIHNTYT